MKQVGLSTMHYPWLQKTREFLSRSVRSVRRTGYRGTVENIAALLEDACFDRIHGTDTSGIVELHRLRISSANKDLGWEYTPSRVRAFRKLMDRLEPLGHVFVDFGCGKGRVLIAAAAYPFRRIVGVEFAPELCEICKKNIAIYRKRTRSSPDVEVVQEDAVDYEIKEDEDMFFFFNPFQPAVMEKVLANIHHSIEANPRRMWIIINNPEGLMPVLQADKALMLTAKYAYGSSNFWLYSNDTHAPVGGLAMSARHQARDVAAARPSIPRD